MSRFTILAALRSRAWDTSFRYGCYEAWSLIVNFVAVVMCERSAAGCAETIGAYLVAHRDLIIEHGPYKCTVAGFIGVWFIMPAQNTL